MTTPHLVLRGGGVVARLVHDGLLLERAGEEVAIPFAAVERVTVDGRRAAIELTAPDGTAPHVHCVEDGSAAAVAAFADAVNRLLPRRARDEPRADGSTLVGVRPLAVRERRMTAGDAALIVPLLAAGALTVAVGVAGGARYSAMLVPAFVGILIGWLTSYLPGRSLYRSWRLRKHGVTVVAQFSHDVDRMRAYRYTDTSGESHVCTTTGHGRRIEVMYDPGDPSRAVVRESPAARGTTAVLGLVGLATLGGTLWYAYLVVSDAFAG
ncbi:DUF3592 domain-containing protein [Streptomyces sp. Tu 3180]|uniref:DUF3592 domain-containing protein n=1 Tax=Streptomyces sp. Tu 3180 TaxID=2682611 RepID=UPI00135AAE2B|nr:DUF3592 domain-containing protein [Streptomyces sp. Tu 3180]KAF3468006.1 hypothetical protein GL259_29365 [Streptomyces sp. Tu 3180]